MSNETLTTKETYISLEKSEYENHVSMNIPLSQSKLGRTNERSIVLNRHGLNSG